MDVQQLGDLLFDKKESSDVFLLTTMLETSYDIFNFCVCLTTYGFIKVCGNGVLVDEIPLNVIEFVKNQLKKAGIDMTITIHTPCEHGPRIELRSRDIVTSIKDIALFMHTQKYTYVITYKLIHHTHKNNCQQHQLAYNNKSI